MKSNPVVWFEIHVQDMARARRFYETVFDGTLEHLPSPDGSDSYEMLSFPMEMTGPGAGGMLVRMDGVPHGGGGTLVYFGCEDCAVEQGRVEAAGGRIEQPKFSIGPHGYCAVVVDTEGNRVGLHSMQ
ncbi:Predicted enzyme related to lactoylglutathione lyase [Delftia tsuruhatensis]|uniref:VOC family protein n=1 Tax=Delftia tsuruhatensis TaxID=180282 RepID=UPI001E79799A|nr:VOC family protein [Delftia tsuruhatensis]CAB5672421.1 Predicted enzyme related to lactoylglutathione lyase [Delftia tsuruhatensis]CAC9683428.1 Predicted enzyme related to lactoylglutathione lyase [Delftia tsuruhatensis]